MPAKKLHQNKKALIIIIIIVAVLFTVGSALAYYNSYRENSTRDLPQTRLQKLNQKRQKQAKPTDQKLIVGEVLGISDNSLSLNVRGESWQVKLSSKTKYRENRSKISKEDIKSGDRVSIFGKKDIKDKSVEAILVRKVK